MLVAAVMVVASVTPAQALAAGAETELVNRVIYTDTGYDPGATEPGTWGDVTKTTRTLLRRDGVRYLKASVKFSDPRTGSNPVRVEVQLDTERNRKPDAVVSVGKLHQKVWCLLVVSDRTIQGRARLTARDQVTCRVPARPLHIDKRIRWRLLVHEPDYGIVVDRAPDGGAWYN